MSFFEVIERRRSIRAYRPDAVAPDALARILACASRAPSAGNLQAYEIVVVTDPAARARLAEAALGQEHVADAPLVLAFLEEPGRSAAKYGARGAGLYALQDATIACAHAQLAATALGLGTCWVGAFDEEGVRRALHAPARVRPVALLTVGRPAEDPEPTGRRRLEDLVRRDRY